MTNQRGPLRVGLIGAGDWALGAHVPALRATGRAQIAAVSSRDAARAEAVVAKLGEDGSSPEPYDDWRELIGSLVVDAVVVTTPPWAHEEAVMEAIRHGKPVLCEAPLATTAAAARALADAADERGVICGYTRPRPFNFGGAAARDALASGAIGAIRSAHLELLGHPWLRATPDQTWRVAASTAPPPLAGLVAGLLLEFFGPVDSVEGSLTVADGDAARAPDVVRLSATHASGVLTEAVAQFAEQPSMFLDVIGTDGTLRWEIGEGGRVVVDAIRGEELVVAEPGPERFTAPAEFVDAVLSGEQHPLDFRRAAAELELVEGLGAG